MPNLCCYCKAIYTERGYNEDNPDPCPHCGRVWFEETDEAEREPTRKHIKAQKPIEPDLNDSSLLASQDLYDYLLDQGVSAQRARIKVASAESCGFVVARSRLVNEERTRTYERGIQEDTFPNEELPNMGGTLIFAPHFDDPEAEAIRRVDKPSETVAQVIDEQWKGTREELVEALKSKWPGKDATDEEKRSWNTQNRRLNRFRKRLKNSLDSSV